MPSDSEWATLINYMGGDETAFTKLSSTAAYIYGFNAAPAGMLCGWGFIPNSGMYRTESADGGNDAWVSYAILVSFWVDRIIVASEPQSCGYNVRYPKNKQNEGKVPGEKNNSGDEETQLWDD